MSNAIECIKCAGSGVIPQFEHYAHGVCFECKGTGMLISHRRIMSLYSVANYHIDGLQETNDTVLRTNKPWADMMCKRAAKALLDVADTEWSRKQLDKLTPGLRAAVIAAGREIKAHM